MLQALDYYLRAVIFWGWGYGGCDCIYVPIFQQNSMSDELLSHLRIFLSSLPVELPYIYLILLETLFCEADEKHKLLYVETLMYI